MFDRVLSSSALVAIGAAEEDAYLSDDSVEPDDMTYEVITGTEIPW